MMTNMNDRQKQAERMANAQIPGFEPDLSQLEPVLRSDLNPEVCVSPPDEAEINRITADVIRQLKSVYDPEIPVDIYELGLIYQVDLEDDRTLKVEMTLTAPGCPVAGEMPIWVQQACEAVAGVRQVEVSMTFDPPWTPERMSEEARLELNML